MVSPARAKWSSDSSLVGIANCAGRRCSLGCRSALDQFTYCRNTVSDDVRRLALRDGDDVVTDDEGPEVVALEVLSTRTGRQRLCHAVELA